MRESKAYALAERPYSGVYLALGIDPGLDQNDIHDICGVARFSDAWSATRFQAPQLSGDRALRRSCGPIKPAPFENRDHKELVDEERCR